jgi:magnesium transporter
MIGTQIPTPDTDRGEAIELWEAWPALDPDERVEAFERLPRAVADDFFLSLDPREQAELVTGLPPAERMVWMRLLPPDDAADMVQEAPPEQAENLLGLLDPTTRREVTALMAYGEDVAGGLMSPRFARVRPDMTVGEAFAYLRRQAPQLETIYYVYVLDSAQRLLGVLSFRDLFEAPTDRRVAEIMRRDVITVPETMDQEEVAHLYREHDLLALPVVSEEGTLKGIVTFDDIADAIREEQTEDIQRIGGSEALDSPYMETPFFRMVRKRAGWLSALFIGEMLTATAMGHFEGEIAQAVVLALFVPLIISSGGNSGSQATTLVIRALALGEVRLRDWWRVAWRELRSGLALGSILGAIGILRILAWQFGGLYDYGPHYALVAFTVGLALVGVVTWGTMAGSMLPFALRRLGFDPASASAPFVATLVDVTGLVIYFTVASVILLHMGA